MTMMHPIQLMKIAIDSSYYNQSMNEGRRGREEEIDGRTK
jgi:hypothetical protein